MARPESQEPEYPQACIAMSNVPRIVSPSMREYSQAQMSFVRRIAYVCVTNEEMTPQYVLHLAVLGNFALQAK